MWETTINDRKISKIFVIEINQDSSYIYIYIYGKFGVKRPIQTISNKPTKIIKELNQTDPMKEKGHPKI